MSVMAVFLRTTIYGTLAGIFFGVILSLDGYFKDQTNPNGTYDEHGYVVIVLILICGVLGALFGLAAGLGAYMKKKFEGEGE